MQLLVAMQWVICSWASSKYLWNLYRPSPHFLHRYRNMDYIILSSLIAIGLLRIIITYDIACQWSRNFHKRVPEYPEHMQLDLERVEVRPAVPDFHIRAHGTDCQQVFTLAFLLHSGRTIGEEVETGWAHMGLAASSIQEMRPANRRETLDDHWGGWNYQKTLTFRKSSPLFCVSSRTTC